jgi:hypothetical protein
VHDRENACLPNTISAHFNLRPVHAAGDNMVDGIRMLPEISPNFSEKLNDVDETTKTDVVDDKPAPKVPVTNDYSQDMGVVPADNVNDLRHGKSYGRAQWTTNVLLVITFIILGAAGYCYCVKKEQRPSSQYRGIEPDAEMARTHF